MAKESQRVTLEEIRKEIGVYNKIVNLYGETFDIPFQTPRYCYKPITYGIRDYQEIKEDLCKLLLNSAGALLEYQQDFYSWKTPLEISQKINCSVKEVLRYLNENKPYIDIRIGTGGITSEFHDKGSENINNTKGGLITESTRIKMASSYQILKEIQLCNRKRAINNHIEKQSVSC